MDKYFDLKLIIQDGSGNLPTTGNLPVGGNLGKVVTSIQDLTDILLEKEAVIENSGVNNYYEFAGELIENIQRIDNLLQLYVNKLKQLNFLSNSYTMPENLDIFEFDAKY